MHNEASRSMLPSSNPLGLAVVAIDVIFLLLSAIAVGIRFKSRSLKGHRLCLNDYLALLAWLSAAGLVSTDVIAVCQGAGQHVRKISPANYPKLLKETRRNVPLLTIARGFIAADITWIAANTAIKTSILHFYLTLFGVNRRFRLVTFGLIGLVLTFGTSVVLKSFLLCRPLAKTWNPALPGTCGSLLGSVIAISLVNVLVDISIILLPMPMVWNLQMARWRKVALTFTFGLGMIVCAFTIARLALASRITADDFSYDRAWVAIVRNPEPLLGIIVACAPVFPPTIKAILDRKHQKSQTNSSLRGFAKMMGNGTGGFDRQTSHEFYPLSAARAGVNETQITSPNSRTSSFHESNTTDPHDAAKEQHIITIKKGWEIETGMSR